ncbi:lysophospholipid acyltransferase family protein [Halopseudomonas bauzanensis]|uniref:1-acyl-sn-glycerol-3-phosphate acyltransferase n=1 Tax=Halopseudomonas bauzanensis TaxID=653930 RepID=A0A4U0YPG7_9GAMM|nr:lysophospholipid acyltransferase family protein [Halopseudomonas bauzanensis]TKA93298.1 1-acyl-sn-glycerol-3-phosphate acyltransferase [Halopseudomonas bauzanensis]
MIKALPKVLFFLLIVRPVVYLMLGLNLLQREKLPVHGPAILAANHNSHLDTLVLMSLYPLTTLHRVRPVAAADYFLRNRFTAWLSLNLIGIIPLDRQGEVGKDKVFELCQRALADDQILLLFPEGSRGDPEQLQPLRKGIYHLARSQPGTRVTPVALHGLGKALPRGGSMIVPFNCDAVVGDPLEPGEDCDAFMNELQTALEDLLTQCITRSKEQEG